MQLIDRINLNHLRVFETVYRYKSMTKAAKELHLTQSGISQHIKSLEDNLGVSLFDRYRQKIIPTGEANTLYERCEKGFHQLEQTLWQITDRKNELAGSVNVGMPVEFGNSLIMPAICEFMKAYPKVVVRFHFGLSHELTSMLLNGDLDFAYVDDFTKDKRVAIETIHNEVIELVATKKYIKSIGPIAHTREFYEKLVFLSYMDGEPVLKSWFRHHLDAVPKMKIRSYLSSPSCLLKLVQQDIGVGAVPRHLLNAMGKDLQKLHFFAGNGEDLIAPISVAYLNGKTHSPVAVELSKAVATKLGVL